MFAAFLAAFANSVEVTADKIMISKRGISVRKFLPLSMTMISFISLAFFPFLGQISKDFYTTKYLVIFVGIIISAFLYNLAYYYALSKEEVCDVEPFSVLDRLTTVIMAAAIFPSERSLSTLIFTLIAVGALFYSRVKRAHFKVRKTTLALIGYVFLIALEAQLVKVILPVISPLALYAARCTILAILFLLFYKPNLQKFKSTAYGQILLLGLITTVEYVAHFYAIAYLGIVKSTLIGLLGPVLIFIYSKFLLKEKLTFKKAVADAIIILCVGASLIIS